MYVCVLQDPDLPLIAEQSALRSQQPSRSCGQGLYDRGHHRLQRSESAGRGLLRSAVPVCRTKCLRSTHTKRNHFISTSSQMPEGQFIEKAISMDMKSKAGAATITLAPSGGSKASYSLAKKSQAHLSSSFRQWAVDGCNGIEPSKGFSDVGCLARSVLYCLCSVNVLCIFY